nr:hypothetical protein [Pseudorhodoplanes sinuspersici]
MEAADQNCATASSAKRSHMQLERVANPKGDRVKITMSGKLLPYFAASG